MLTQHQHPRSQKFSLPSRTILFLLTKRMSGRQKLFDILINMMRFSWIGEQDQLHSGQNPLICLLLVLQNLSCLYSCKRLSQIKLILVRKCSKDIIRAWCRQDQNNFLSWLKIVQDICRAAKNISLCGNLTTMAIILPNFGFIKSNCYQITAKIV